MMIQRSLKCLLINIIFIGVTEAEKLCDFAEEFPCEGNCCYHSKKEAVISADCSELPAGSVSGVYTIQPGGSHPYSVYCDMDTDGGGWTVFQRRQDGSVDFFLNWTDYDIGFGPVNGEHWLGNARIAQLTKQKVYSLRVDMKDFEGSSNYATYGNFKVTPDDSYTLEIGEYKGEAGDAMGVCNGQQFSTKNKDNDHDENKHCAVKSEGAWWYKDCHKANLNGQYMPGGKYQAASSGPFPGIEWLPWKGRGYSMAFTEMKLRPKDF